MLSKIPLKSNLPALGLEASTAHREVLITHGSKGWVRDRKSDRRALGDPWYLPGVCGSKLGRETVPSDNTRLSDRCGCSFGQCPRTRPNHEKPTLVPDQASFLERVS